MDFRFYGTNAVKLCYQAPQNKLNERIQILTAENR